MKSQVTRWYTAVLIRAPVSEDAAGEAAGEDCFISEELI